MTTLILLEFDKMIRKKSFCVCLALMFCCCVAFYIINVDPTGRNLHIAAEDGTMRSGRDAIELEREMTKRYAGTLTDERIWEMYRDLMAQPDFGQVDSNPYPTRVLEQFFLPYRSMERGFGGEAPIQSAEGQLERDQLLKLGDLFAESAMPLEFGYSVPWSGMLQSLIASLFAMNLLVLIAVSPLFSEEHTFQMNALLFTSKYGRKKCFIAKTAVAYIMGIVLSAVIILLHVLVTLVLFGSEGLNSSIQLSEPFLFQRLADFKTVGSAIVDAVWLYTADVLITIGLTILASVLASHVLTGMVLSFAFFCAPMFFLGAFQQARIKLIMPANHLIYFERVLSVSPLCIGSVKIAYSYVIVGITMLCAVLATAGAARIYETLPEEGITWLEN